MLKCEFISKQKYMQGFWSGVLDSATKYLIGQISAEEEEMQDAKSLYIPLRNLLIQILVNYSEQSIIDQMFHFVYQNIVDS